MSNTQEGFLRALSSGLDRLQAASTATLNRPLIDPSLREAVTDHLGPEVEQKIYDDAVRMAESVQVLDSKQKRKLSAGQVGNYLMHGGIHCPDCLSHQITGGQFDCSEGRCWQNVSCTECGCEWRDEYQLVAVNNVSFRRGEEDTLSNSQPNS